MSRALDARYICQSAANAIISEIGPYRVSNDALQTINQFLDEFLVYLLSSSLSLDLSRIKAVVFTLLPSTLGKNAIVEAELEVKTFTETEAIDYETYERMRMLGSTGAFPLNETLPLLREKCLEFCTLADREEPHHPMALPNRDISIAPIVAIYVTTVLEHIAEYVLTAIAMTAEHEDVEYIRIKEVFLALIDDVQVGGVFYRMELREKLEKRAFAHGYRPRTSTYAPSIQQKHMRNSTAGSIQQGGDGYLDIAFDDMDLGYDDDDTDRPSRTEHLSMYSMRSNVSQQRPTSMMSSSTSNGTISTFDSASNSKKAYKVFKKDGMEKSAPVSVSVYDPEAPTMNFEDLIRSGNTMRVSLTPNRLRSIEVKDQTVEEPPRQTNWERRSTASLSRSRGSAPPSRSASPAPQLRMPPPPRPASTTPPTMRKKDAFAEEQELEPKKSSLGPKPRPAGRPAEHKPQPQSPVAREVAVKPAPIRFENPREAPEPPKPKHTPVPVSPKPASPVEVLSPVEKGPASVPASVPVPVPAPVPVPVPVPVPAPAKQAPPPISPPVEKTAAAVKSAAVEKTAAVDKPATTEKAAPVEKAQPAKKEEVRVMRRSSMSSRKSRENLRRQREKDALAAAAAAAAELPKQSSPVISAKSSQESVREEDNSVLPSPPTSETASTASKDSLSEDEEKKAVRFDKEDDDLMDSPDEMDEKPKDAPERPSTIVAKRASMAGSSRRHSLHENYAVSETMERKTTAGSVESTVKGWETLMKNGEEIAPVAQRRRSLMKKRSEDEATGAQPRDPPLATHHPRPVSSVLDKVMKFEQASSLDDFAQEHHRQHRASAYIPRRERFLYLQREPGLLERRTQAAIKPRPIAVNAEVQTDPLPEMSIPPALIITTEDEMGVTTRKEVDMESGSEHGMVDGDEEWFLQDDEWEDTQDQENAVVEWLLGEA